MTKHVEGDEVTLTMTRDEYGTLMDVLVVATSRLVEDQGHYLSGLEFIQELLRLNAGDTGAMLHLLNTP
jgi:hypothetical protein